MFRYKCLCHCLIANSLGKPAAADLSLGLATAPVLFAAETFPHLNTLIGTSVKFTSRLLYYWCWIVVSVIYQSWWVFYFSDSLIEEIKKSANNLMILARRFEADGDVEEAFRLVFSLSLLSY